MKSFLSQLFRLFLILSTILGVVIVGASFLGSIWWGFDLLSHFRVQYLIGLSLFLSALVIMRKKLLLFPIAVIFILNFAQIFPFYLPNIPSARAGNLHNTTEIYFANVYYKLDNVKPLIAEIREENPDFAVFAELNESAFLTVKSELSDYPYVYFIDSYNAFDLSVVSKKPLEKIQTIYFGQQTQSPTLVFSIEQKGKNLKIIGVHTHTPVKESMKQDRDEELAGIANYVSVSNIPVVVLGDFNSTAWSDGYDVLQKQGNLTDSQLHQGVQASWPAYLPSFLRIPIDQALVSSNVRVLDRKVGEDIGSDHLPIVLNIEW